MRKIFIVSLLLCFFFCAVGQTQNGFVKTRGRIVNGQHIYGKGLVGATVQIKGRNSIVVKSNNGAFSFPINSKQYVIQSVKKNGYQLVDADAFPKTYSYSVNPIYFVMDVPSQQMEDKLATERKLRRTLSRQLQEREDEIERLKEQNKLTEEQYHKALQDLYAEQEKSQDLVSQMAERYSRIDFDQLDEFNRQVSECIIEGRLTEADSLIKSKGDMKERIALHNKHHEANVQARKSLEDSEAMELKDRDDLAEDCYNQFLIHKLQHHPDSAAFYIEQRALLDTTNVDWLYDAACYLKDIGNIDKALTIFLKIHTHYVESGAIDIRHALILETIADIYYIYNHNCERSVEYYTHAIDEFEKINYLHPHLVHCYDYLALGLIVVQASNNKATTNDINNALMTSKIGGRYDNDSTPPVFFGSNNIMNRIIDSQIIDVENIYLGEVIAFGNDDEEKLFDYYERALNKVDSVYGSDSERYAKVQVAYGHALMRYCKDNEGIDRALKCYQTANQVFTNIDSMHPDLGDLYKSLAPIYLRNKKDTIAAMNYYHKAIHIYSSLFGPHHPELSQIYDELTGLYKKMEKFDQALDYGFISIELKKRLYGAAISNRGNLTISSIYRDMGDYDKAIEYLEVYRSFCENNQLKSSHNLSFFDYSYYSVLGDIYFLKKEYPNALDAYHKILDYYKAEYDSVSLSSCWDGYGKMGYVVMSQGDTVMAVKYFIRSLELLQNGELSPDWKSDIESYCDNIKKYYVQKELTNAVNCYYDFLNYLSQKKHITKDDIGPIKARSILKLIMQCKQNE